MFYAHSESAQLDRSNESVRAQAETTRRDRQDEVQNPTALCSWHVARTNFTRLGFPECRVPIEPCENRAVGKARLRTHVMLFSFAQSTTRIDSRPH